MRCSAQQISPILMALGLLFPAALPARGADPEIDRLLQSPVGKDWVTNGGNMTNERYSTLKQIDTTNVKQLKGRRRHSSKTGPCTWLPATTMSSR